MKDEPVFMTLSRGYDQQKERHAEINLGNGLAVTDEEALNGTSRQKLAGAYDVITKAEDFKREYDHMYEQEKAKYIEQRNQLEEAKRVKTIKEMIKADLDREFENK
ncbi:hypothetical protein [Gottfriedia acidiceleris]|uniref:Uncharacterized protein n=1 Tax=Gottfriedia acidiceleris TaxID=371036 RepID=A0ABY4JH01_9BACI|nr:hypothetical protein [Gottfriedia acidiceleris]UPM53101.1 hypothetical protein MY490_14915 [Gottfriedia acidiceleris]